jgi:Dyp-type peroxidase family
MDTDRFLFNAELIDANDPVYDTFLQNLQGNILKGHGRKFTRNIFLGFKASSRIDIKQKIADLATESSHQNWWEDLRITSAYQQKEQSEMAQRERDKILTSIFASFFLSAKGYGFFGIEPPNDPAFQLGMRESLEWPSYARHALVKKLNKDPGSIKNDLRTSFKKGKMNKGKWASTYTQEIHAMVLLANDEEQVLDAAEKKVSDLFYNLSHIFHVERGSRIQHPFQKQSTEHFGFVDNISNPIFFKQDYEKAQKREIPSKFDQYDPKASLALVLVNDVHGGENAYGSYLVFQKLEQNVKKFSDQIDQLQARLGITKELAEAFVIGRFKDGTPAVISSLPGMNPPPNNFNYYKDEWNNDDVGMRCPLHAHIRKMNPRRGSYRDNRIVRRGITYDNRPASPDFIAEKLKDSPPLPERDLGILFMCFQSDVGQQYETLVKEWAFDGTPRAGIGTDPILAFNSASHHDPTTTEGQNWPLRWGGMEPIHQKERFPWEQVIQNQGGEYFFAPSLSFLKNFPAFP